MSSFPPPPGPKSFFPLKHVFAMRRDPLAFFLRMRDTYGDVVRIPMGPETIWLISDPALIQEVFSHKDFIKGRGLQRAKRLLGEGLLTSEGEIHKRQRRLSQPAFHRKRIESYTEVMGAYTLRHVGGWKEGQTVDLAAEMMRLTLAIVGKTLFDADTEGEAQDIGDALTILLESIWLAVLMPFSDLLEKIPFGRPYHAKKAILRLDTFVEGLIRERRTSGEDRGDLLSILLQAQDTEGDQRGMTDRQVRDEVMTLLVAGHETTANLLTWAFYLLAQHPHVEAALHEEIDRVIGDRLPTMEDVKSLVYTERVLAETLRIYPPAWTMGRRATKEIVLGGEASEPAVGGEASKAGRREAADPSSRPPIGPTTIAAGDIVILSPYVVHRDPKWYPEPLTMKPERFTPEAKEARPATAYIPFGGGARRCIGEAFAWMEGTILLAVIARRYKVSVLASPPVIPQPLITLRPKHGIAVRLHARQGAA